MALYIDDDKMRYDLENHRYVLTEDGFRDYAGYSLRDYLDSEGTNADLAASFFLRRASENVYALLESMATYDRAMECWLALPINRAKIYNALCREASDMLVMNRDPSEEAKDGKPACSIGLQMILEGLYGRYFGYLKYRYGEDY